MQTLYGVWDPSGYSPSKLVAPWKDESNQRINFKRQTILNEPVVVPQVNGGTKTFFRTSSNSVDWETQRGWYMDLTLPDKEADAADGAGQRTIYEVDTVGEFAFFYTIKPGSVPFPCESSSGAGYNFIVESVTGSAYAQPVLDIQGDQVVDSKDKLLDPAHPDMYISGFSSPSEGRMFIVRGTGSPDSVDNFSGNLIGNSTDEFWKTYCLKLNCKISDRVWKQIISPPQPN